MFALVALMCFYIGGNNIKKAFIRAPFGQWQAISWALFITGIILIPVGLLCLRQAMKDYSEAQASKEAKARAEKEKRRQQFFYDDETTEETAEETEDTADE